MEQDHRGVKSRYDPMYGFNCPGSVGEFRRAYDELRNFLRSDFKPISKSPPTTEGSISFAGPQRS
jgi:hypothetical protein